MKKIFLRITLVCVIVCIAALLAALCINFHVKNTAEGRIVSPDSLPQGQYDCILVLGCGVRENGTPSPMLADRLDRAIALYRAGAAPKLIMSGDHGRKEYDEVNTMRAYALERGVPEEDLFMDHAGFSTYESIYRAKEIFCVTGMIVVTQRYHLYRALYTADAFGINAVGVSADYREYAGQSFRELREIAARCKDFLQCIVKPAPTFLGDTIPVSGDGTVTWD